MGMPRKIDRFDIPKILHDVRQGMKQADVAVKYGVSQPHVSRIAKRCHVRFNRGLTQGQRKSIVAAYRDKRLSQRDIADRFGISQQHVGEILRRCGVEARCRSLTMNEQRRIISEYNSGLPITDIARRLGRSKSSVARFLHRKEIPVRENRKWKFNEQAFQERSVATAYWMGFLFADGNIRRRKKSCVLTLAVSESDLEHLHGFCHWAGIDVAAVKIHAVEQRSGHVSMMARLEINHKDLADWVRPWGIVERKTYRFVPPAIEASLLPHFLRGWFDGDGHVSHSTGKGCVQFTIVNHERDAVQWYADRLVELGFEGKFAIRESRGCWHLNSSDGASLKSLYSVLEFDTPPSLERKRRKLAEIADRFTPAKKLDEWTSLRAALLYESGRSCKAIGEIIGVSEQTVYQHVRKHGVKIRWPNTPLSLQHRIVELYVEKGLSQGKIARIVGVGRGAVRAALKRQGVKLRKRGKK